MQRSSQVTQLLEALEDQLWQLQRGPLMDVLGGQKRTRAKLKALQQRLGQCRQAIGLVDGASLESRTAVGKARVLANAYQLARSMASGTRGSTRSLDFYGEVLKLLPEFISKLEQTVRRTRGD